MVEQSFGMYNIHTQVMYNEESKQRRKTEFFTFNFLEFEKH